ncbi:MAG: O-antigen polysaccharide polymerase Wzy [Planctomycetota bacterium]
MRLTLLAVTLVRSFDLLYLARVQDRKRMGVVAVIAACFGLVTGGRLEVVAVAIVVALKLRLSLKRSVFVGALLVFLALMAGWKSAHYYYLATFENERVARGVFDASEASLTDIESYASVMVLCEVLEHPCPWQLGSTYTWDVLQSALPREMRSERWISQAAQFAWTHTPERAARGIGTGYSAIAESWTNFGTTGPLAAGIVMGIASGWIDRRRRDVLFIVFALIAFRYFRSDAASLLKSWVVICGGSMALAAFIYQLAEHLGRALHLRRASGSIPAAPRSRFG